MKKLRLVLLMVLLCTIAVMASDVANVTPDKAMTLLKEGNERFVAGKRIQPNLEKKQMEETAEKGQHPFATIISCSDSRVPVEHVFDRGLGDLFVVRVAGNVMGIDEVATVEYAYEHLHTPVIVVMGHTHCGAVSASAGNASVHGSLPYLLQKIAPAVERVKVKYPDLKGEAFVDKCIEENVLLGVEDLYRLSPGLKNMVKEGKVQVVPALYDIKTGKVKWLEINK